MREIHEFTLKFFLGAMILNATQAVGMVNHVTGFDYMSAITEVI
jgi:hypothetical protein